MLTLAGRPWSLPYVSLLACSRLQISIKHRVELRLMGIFGQDDGAVWGDEAEIDNCSTFPSPSIFLWYYCCKYAASNKATTRSHATQFILDPNMNQKSPFSMRWKTQVVKHSGINLVQKLAVQTGNESLVIKPARFACKLSLLDV